MEEGKATLAKSIGRWAIMKNRLGDGFLGKIAKSEWRGDSLHVLLSPGYGYRTRVSGDSRRPETQVLERLAHPIDGILDIEEVEVPGAMNILYLKDGSHDLETFLKEVSRHTEMIRLQRSNLVLGGAKE